MTNGCEKMLNFKSRSFEFKKAVIEIAISIISTILVLLTLFEMQADRNAAYRPDISFADAEVAIAWDGELETENTEENQSWNLDSFFETYDVNVTPQLMMYNIGVGTAKNIKLQWDHGSNVENFIEAFEPYDDISILLDDNMIYIETDKSVIGQGVGNGYTTEFMLSSVEDYCTIQFPIAYSYLIRELLTRSLPSNQLPTLSLSVTYTDIQNKTYSKCINIYIQTISYISDAYGNGCCVYELHFTEEDLYMPTIGAFIIDSDSLAAISSFFAVIVSIISMIFTVIFSVLQNKHNKNSVRPISAIKLNDYEDQISVRIDNVGTGPLLIQKLRFRIGETEHKTLISLMPEVGQNWVTFTEEVDGWTIPVNGRITLIKIHPEKEIVKTLVRKKLSQITVSLDYTDIYSTRFHDERSLSFFGRHFE